MRMLLVSMLLSLFATQLSAAPVTEIYAFGDSYSDNGASQALTHAMLEKGLADAQQLPGELYWQGRWSNGPTAVEVLAQRLDAKLIDFAVGGAKSGKNNYYAWMTPYQDTGVSGQVDHYLATLEGKPASSTALYFVFISANDFFEHEDFNLPQSIEQLARNSKAHIENAVERLANAGAKRFLIISSSDLSIVPAVAAAGQVAKAQEFQRRLNASLSSALTERADKQGLELNWFDHIAFSEGVRSQAEKYGLNNIDQPCQPTYPQIKAVCATPDTYYFWDEWHPTRHIHKLAGEAMAALYKH